MKRLLILLLVLGLAVPVAAKSVYFAADHHTRAFDAWNMNLCAQTPDLYSDTVSAVVVPEGFDGTKLVTHASEKPNAYHNEHPHCHSGHMF